MVFKNNAPFINCITKINGIKIDNAEDLDAAMPICIIYLSIVKIMKKQEVVYGIIIKMNQIVVFITIRIIRIIIKMNQIVVQIIII